MGLDHVLRQLDDDARLRYLQQAKEIPESCTPIIESWLSARSYQIQAEALLRLCLMNPSKK